MGVYLSTTDYLRGLAVEAAQAVSPGQGPRVPPELLELLAGGGAPGAEWSAEQVAAATEGLAVVERAIADAEREANSYLAAVEAIPLAPARVAASPLPGHVRALARWRIVRVRAEIGRDSPVRIDVDRALRWLERAADGRAVIAPLEGEGPTEPAATGWKVQAPRGRINWGSYP